MLVLGESKRICVIRLSAIGDTCHALAVIRRIQDNWPEAKVTWIIGKTEASLMANIPDIEFIIFDKSDGRYAYGKLTSELRGRTFDVALCMHASMRANFICRTVAAPIRLGFDRARAKDLQWLFTNRRINAVKGEHALEAMMSFARAIGADERPLRWDIPLDAQAQQFARDHRRVNNPLVVVSPCSSQRSRNFRNWSVENYAAVIHYLSEKNCRVVLTGGPSRLEKDYGDELAAATAAENRIGATSLQQLAALIAAADLVICPDSGPAHVATALDTPVLGLYATSDPRRTGPYKSADLTVDRYPDATRKYLGKAPETLRWGQRVRHPEAMKLITIDDVRGKIDVFLGNLSTYTRRA